MYSKSDHNGILILRGLFVCLCASRVCVCVYDIDEVVICRKRKYTIGGQFLGRLMCIICEVTSNNARSLIVHYNNLGRLHAERNLFLSQLHYNHSCYSGAVSRSLCLFTVCFLFALISFYVSFLHIGDPSSPRFIIIVFFLVFFLAYYPSKRTFTSTWLMPSAHSAQEQNIIMRLLAQDRCSICAHYLGTKRRYTTYCIRSVQHRGTLTMNKVSLPDILPSICALGLGSGTHYGHSAKDRFSIWALCLRA